MLPPAPVGPRNLTPAFFLCCKQEIRQLLQSYSPRYVTGKHKNKTLRTIQKYMFIIYFTKPAGIMLRSLILNIIQMVGGRTHLVFTLACQSPLFLFLLVPVRKGENSETLNPSLRTIDCPLLSPPMLFSIWGSRSGQG